MHGVKIQVRKSAGECGEHANLCSVCEICQGIISLVPFVLFVFPVSSTVPKTRFTGRHPGPVFSGFGNHETDDSHYDPSLQTVSTTRLKLK